MAQSSTVFTDIAASISQVNSEAGEMSDSSALVKMNADELSKLSTRLNTVVRRFKF